jgi:hypothetical protein
MLLLLILCSKLPPARIDILVQALLDQLPESDPSAVIGVKQDNVAVVPPNGPNPATGLPSYDPSTPFILELCTILTIRDGGCDPTTTKQVLDAIHGILRDHSQWHGITVSRAAFYGLMILKSGYVCTPAHAEEVALTNLNMKGPRFRQRSHLPAYHLQLTAGSAAEDSGHYTFWSVDLYAGPRAPKERDDDVS